jgi:class 3 adenylate cyclase
VIHRTEDSFINIAAARLLAERIPNAKLVELPGIDHLYFIGEGTDQILDEMSKFLTGTDAAMVTDRVLATMLFLDIVGSTERAVAMGDEAWRELLNAYYALVRKELARFRGREIDTAGDGFFATFDGPGRAIQCAFAVTENIRRLNLEVRAGVHTGECELIGENVGGIAVHIGARVMSLAGANEVLVSSTVKDLVAGSGFQFQDWGLKTLKGVPGEWHIYAAVR